MSSAAAVSASAEVARIVCSAALQGTRPISHGPGAISAKLSSAASGHRGEIDQPLLQAERRLAGEVAAGQFDHGAAARSTSRRCRSAARGAADAARRPVHSGRAGRAPAPPSGCRGSRGSPPASAAARRSCRSAAGARSARRGQLRHRLVHGHARAPYSAASSCSNGMRWPGGQSPDTILLADVGEDALVQRDGRSRP